MAAFIQPVEESSVISKSTNQAGNGLFATKEIKVSVAILSVDKSLMLALDTPRLKDTCYCCCLFRGRSAHLKRDNKTKEKTLKACTGCGVVRYCDKECQKSSWNDHHKLECKIFAKLQPNILPNNVRAVLRLLLLRKVERVAQMEWDRLMGLEAHIDNLRKVGGETWQNLCLMTKAAKEYSSSALDEHTIFGLFCRLMINSFTLVTPMYDPIGLILHPLPATLNHSCDYNATIRISSEGYFGHAHKKIEVIPLRQIEKGEEIVISYIDANLPFHIRQKELRERYFFVCKCQKCLQGPTTAADIFLDSPITTVDLQEMQKVEDRAVELLKSAESDTSVTGPILKLKYAVYLLQETRVWPLHRHPLPALRHQLILAYLDAHQYNLAFAHAAVQCFKVDPVLMPQRHHPIRMVHDWVFVLLMDYIMYPEQSDWTAQKFDLVSRKIDIRYWQTRAIRDLNREKGMVPPSNFTAAIRNKHHEIWYDRYGVFVSEAWLDDKEIYEKEYGLMEKMMDDVLAADGAWQAAT